MCYNNLKMISLCYVLINSYPNIVFFFLQKTYESDFEKSVLSELTSLKQQIPSSRTSLGIWNLKGCHSSDTFKFYFQRLVYLILF